MSLANNAWELLSDNLPSAAERVAVVDGSRRCTYAELAERAAAIAGWLVDRGVGPGDRVAVYLRKSLEQVAAHFAIWRAGAVVVDVSDHWTAAQLEYVVRDCEVRALVTDDRRARSLGDVAVPAMLVVGGSGVDPRSGAPVVQRSDRDLATIIYTSGSTGLPKGVMLSHRNLVLGATSVVEYLGLRADDRLLGLLPLCFDYGLNQLLTSCLVGATLVLQAIPMPSEIAKTIAAENVTGFAAVPPAWVQLVRWLHDTGTRLPSLRYVTNSGGKIPRAVLELMPRVLPGVDIVLMYGLTEAFRSTWLPPAKFAAKMGAIGQPIPNARCWVVDAELGVCGPGQEGELVHAGPLVSMGYWNRPDDTREKIRPCPQLAHLIGDEPVVYSGDIVRIDDDGDLWFVGRRDGMIKSSGFRLSPTEVEEIAHGSGLVGEAVAFGVDDELLGQAVHVAVTPVRAEGDPLVDTAALERYFARHMPHYMVPKRIHVRSAMPRTASGKIDRPRVVAEARAG